MKKVTKFFMAALLTGMCSLGYAQSQPDYMKAPKPNEKILGIISIETNKRQSNAWTDQEVYALMLEKAKSDYPNRVVNIREMDKEMKISSEVCWDDGRTQKYGTFYKCNATGKVVWVMSNEDIAQEFNKNLSQAFNKALRNVREGSRLAIDQVTVISSMDRGEFKDQLIDVLLDKGYKVVAKEYLDKLYEEQQGQQSGIYNDKTTVQENNFSAVGYYINVKVTETSLRVQVVNVSTGEYEGNAMVNF
jgi:hypothetical protein